jgi:hypothetical protein
MSTGRTVPTLATRWMCALVSLLGACEVLMGLGAGSLLTRVVGIVGGLALAAAPWLTGRVRGLTLTLLVVGTVPFAALTVTSLISPLLAVLAWILMGLILRDRSLARPAVPGIRREPAHEAGAASS